jgi:hypothetical protein
MHKWAGSPGYGIATGMPTPPRPPVTILLALLSAGVYDSGVSVCETEELSWTVCVP